MSGLRSAVTATLCTAALLAAVDAHATIDPKCEGIPLPGDYNEQAQQDFLQNYFALSTTFSAIHAPVPHAPGHGAIGLELGGIPPLGCERRLVLNYTKSEDTNKTPIIPRPRISYAFPAIGVVIPYASLGYIPPVKLFGITNAIVSGEIGVGVPVGEVFQFGGRFHTTAQKTIGEIATPFVEGDPAFDDLYIANTFGLDLMVGFDLDAVTPYLSIGWTDASTFFYIGDDSVVINNFHPYFGPAFSLGVDGLVAERFRFGVEAYAAPGGHSRPDKDAESLPQFNRYGQIYTGRMRIAYEL